jgi:hypothetical protein
MVAQLSFKPNHLRFNYLVERFSAQSCAGGSFLAETFISFGSSRPYICFIVLICIRRLIVRSIIASNRSMRASAVSNVSRSTIAINSSDCSCRLGGFQDNNPSAPTNRQPPNSSVRKPRQPKPVLAAEASAALSDQLIAEIQRLKEEEDLALWAHRRLPAKNTLTADDARIVEAAYQVVLSALNPAVDEQGPAEPISPAQGSEGDATPMTAAPEDQRPQDQEKVTPLHKPMRRRNTAPTSHSSPRSPAWSVSARRAMPII